MRFLIILVFVVGCMSPESETPIQITHDVCGSIVVSAPGATDAQLAAIDVAMALWHARGVPRLTRAIDDGEAAIEITFSRRFPAIRGHYDDVASTISINEILDPGAVAVVVAHELGHAFGLVHVTAYASVMAPGNLDVAPTVEDQQSLEVLWGVCDPQ